MSALQAVFGAVAAGRIPPGDGARLLRAIAKASTQMRAANELTPAMVAAIMPEAIPFIEDIAGLLYPGADKAIAVLVVINSLSHKMTADEERQWFDRASAPSNT